MVKFSKYVAMLSFLVEVVAKLYPLLYIYVIEFFFFFFFFTWKNISKGIWKDLPHQTVAFVVGVV